MYMYMYVYVCVSVLFTRFCSFGEIMMDTLCLHNNTSNYSNSAGKGSGSLYEPLTFVVAYEANLGNKFYPIYSHKQHLKS